MRNIVLIGMPGCGKSTVGQQLAQALGRVFLETDTLIVQQAGCSIPDIFAAQGEALFRSLETQAVLQVSAQENVVISTGGGVILRPENMEALGKTGLIFFLDRDPADIANSSLEGRPLIGGDETRVFTLYAQRIALYQAYGQYPIRHCTTPTEAVEQILETLRREGLYP